MASVSCATRVARILAGREHDKLAVEEFFGVVMGGDGSGVGASSTRDEIMVMLVLGMQPKYGVLLLVAEKGLWLGPYGPQQRGCVVLF